VNAGAFTFDPADPSVGIFGEAWYCDCGHPHAALEFPCGEVNRRGGVTEFYVLLTCEDCVAQRIVSFTDYTGWDEPPDYGFDETWDQPRQIGVHA
jgi:hypothetical protein